MGYLFDPTDAHIKQALENISIAYSNAELIWSKVAPVVPVGKTSDYYYIWDENTAFNVTSDQLSATGRPNPILMKFSTDQYATKPYGLLGEVPVITLENADDVLDPLSKTTEAVTKQLQLQQEIRAAALVFTAANYATGYKATLSGTDQWSDFTNSDPLIAWRTALDTCLERPNTMVLGLDAWRGMQSHPKIVAAVYPQGGNSANRGNVTDADLSNLLAAEGITQILIGRARYNTANIGQTGSLSRVWGKHCAFIKVAEAPARDMASFAYTFASNQATVTRALNAMAGARGVEEIKVAWEVDTKITAQKAGYLFTNCVA